MVYTPACTEANLCYACLIACVAFFVLKVSVLLLCAARSEERRVPERSYT